MYDCNDSLDEFREIIKLFELDSGDEVESYISFGRLFIRGNDNELMLRINEFWNELVIARICFNNKRDGFGTQLLLLLEDYMIDRNFTKIKVESVFTPEMISFCKKYNFINEPSMFKIDGEHYPNWIKIIK